jgi:putative ABC transport system permease protein
MLKPLPYPQAERWVALYAATFSQPELRGSSSFPDRIEYQRRTHSFDVFGWFRPTAFILTSPGQPQHLTGLEVTPELAHSLGVNPFVGRWFSNETEAVISNALWQRLGRSPKIVGQGITLDGRVYTVAGVMGPTFRLPVPGPGIDSTHADVWIPLDPNGKGQNRQEAMLFSYARLKPGVNIAQAQEDVLERSRPNCQTGPQWSSLLHRAYG